jgi:NitT/TauT family transport system permease protein
MTSTVPVPDLAELPRAARMAPSTSARGLRRLGVTLGPPLIVLVLLIGAWYAGTYLLVDPDLRFLLPPPHEVLRVAFLDADNRNELLG